MADWRRFTRGKAEVQAGIVLLIVGLAGFLVLAWWNSDVAPSAPGTVFTSHGYVAGVVTVMLAGVVGLGVGLLVLGAVLRAIQRVNGRD